MKISDPKTAAPYVYAWTWFAEPFSRRFINDVYYPRYGAIHCQIGAADYQQTGSTWGGDSEFAAAYREFDEQARQGKANWPKLGRVVWWPEYRMPDEPAVPELRGLTYQERKRVRDLIACMSEKRFDRRLRRLVEGGNPRSVLLTTHLMLELPWQEDLEPRHRGDLRMRKLRVEKALDHLVAARVHDTLSAQHFRSLDPSGPDPEEAKRNLIDWTLANLDSLVWDPEASRFSPPDR